MFDKRLIIQDFNKAAGDYDSHSYLQKKVAKRLLFKAENCFKDNDKILDIGSGTGYLSRESGERWQVKQIDMSISMCEVAASYAPVVNGDMDYLPFKNHCFDGAFSSLVLQWSNNLNETFLEVFRILKNNGVLLFSILGKHSLKEMKSVFGDVGRNNSLNSFHNLETLETELKRAGFSNIKYESKEVVFYYSDAIELMKSIKSIGAGNKLEGRRKSFGKKLLSDIKNKYEEEFGIEDDIPATWEVLYFSCKRKG